MSLLKKIVRKTGYEVIKSVKHHPSLQSHLSFLLDKLKIDLVLDIGANNGSFGLFLRKIGYNGHILSFEPVKKCFDELERCTKKSRNWKAFNYALGPRECELEINVPPSTDFSSFLRINEFAKLNWPECSMATREIVEIRKLDDVFTAVASGFKFKNVFMKLDTQGYDLEVIKGANNTMKEVAGVQTELSIIPLYEGMPHYIEALSTFNELGFVPTGFYPVSRDDKELTLIEIDCIMRRKHKNN